MSLANATTDVPAEKSAAENPSPALQADDSMSVYLAARWELAPLMREWRGLLAAGGVGCTSRWLDIAATGLRAIESDATNERAALVDVVDIMAADLFVLYSPKAEHGTGRGGRHVETGIAIAARKPIILVGERENIFHWHPSVVVFPDIETLIGKAS